MVPRPIRSGLAVTAFGLLPLVLGLTAVIRPLWALVFAAIFVAAGGLKWSLAHFALNGIRRRADLELRQEPRPYLLSSFAQWRAGELTSRRHRLALAHALTRMQRDLSPALLPGASPLNRVAVRPHAHVLGQLTERLAALDRPVTAQAVLQVEELMTSPESPLYARERIDELRPALLAAVRALDGRPDRPSREHVPISGQQKIRAGWHRGRGLSGKTIRPSAASLRGAQERYRRLVIVNRRSHG